MSAPQRHPFTAETGQVLHLVIHSLYSKPEIFLRELVANGADALDKLRLEALRDPALLGEGAELRVEVEADPATRTVTVRDNGIGMTRAEIAENLGTVARSGTARYASELVAQGQGAEGLIGQFGVGFYAAFIVAERVEVRSRRAGQAPEAGVVWRSDGVADYELDDAPREAHGTEVVLHLKSGQDEFLAPERLEHIVHTYAEHLPFPVRLKGADGQWRTVNTPQALWTRPRGEITAEEYAQYYRELTGDLEPPLAYLHARIEGGAHTYTALLYVPAHPPAGLWQLDREHGVRLHVRRVFILEDNGRVLPRWLRFVRGVVDSDDLPLNVSREMLQDSRAVDAIRAGCTRRVLERLATLAQEEPERYLTFWHAFGAVLKEGLAEDTKERERLVALLRFASTADPERLTSLDEYVARMPQGQDAIWYLVADRPQAARAAPHLEAWRAQGTEVLLLTDPVDPWVVAALREHAGKPLRAVTEHELPAGETPARPADDALCTRIKDTLGERVSAVRGSTRLIESPACLVPAPGALLPSLVRTLRAAGTPVPESAPVLEINAAHPLLAALAAERDAGRFADLAYTLLGGAALAQGELPADPADFAARLHRLLGPALAGRATDAPPG
jgi:molecular chaperone HtpG